MTTLDEASGRIRTLLTEIESLPLPQTGQEYSSQFLVIKEKLTQTAQITLGIVGQGGLVANREEKLNQHITDIEGRLTTFEQEIRYQRGVIDGMKNDKHGKSILECKSISNLSALSADKSLFRNWEDRLINAYIQFAGTTARTLFGKTIEAAELKSGKQHTATGNAQDDEGRRR